MGGVDGVMSDTFFGLGCHKLSPHRRSAACAPRNTTSATTTSTVAAWNNAAGPAAA
jgi:hypothetical protein